MKRPISSSRNSWYAALRLALVVTTVATVLAGCADDDTERRFANDPRRDETPEFVPSTPAVPPTLPPATQPVALSPAELLLPGGGPTTAVFVIDGVAYVIDPAANRVSAVPGDDGARVVAATVTSTGYALMLRREAGDRARYDLVVVDALGTVTRTVEGVTAPLGDGGRGDGRDLVAASGDGARIVVMPRTGGAVLVDGDAAPQVLVAAERAVAPVSLALTTDGGAVLYAAASERDGHAQLWVSSLRAMPIDPVQVIDGDATTSVRTADWLPDGTAVLFVDQRPAAVAGGGDIYLASRRTLDGNLLVSSYRVAPDAAIVAIAPSPDGRGVAYAAIAPGNAVSVWVQQIGSANAVRVALASDAPLAAISWTAAGLVVTTISGGEVRAQVVTIDGALRDVGAAPLPATPTPSPSPTLPATATPVATATRTPAPATATPVATVTPAAAPSATAAP